MPKVDVIRANAARYPISAQCRIPDVPHSTYYWMTGHPETEHVDSIAGDARAARRDSRERYGARKIKAALERRGVTASRRRIGNIMREQGMTSAYTRRRFKPHGILGHGSVFWFPTSVLSFWQMKKTCAGRGPCLSLQRRKPKARKNPDVIATAG